MLNKFCAIGRLTKDPELRRTNTGAAVASFNIAVNRSFKNQQGEYEADFIPCVAWNKTAENIDLYCEKGSLIAIEARMQSRSYDNAQGQKVYVIEAICESVQFLDKKKDQQQQSQPQQQQTQANNFYDVKTVNLEKEFDNSFNSFDIMEDDIGF